MHDPRLGRFFAVDPLAAKYPYWTPYQFSGNQVINMVELEGLEPAEAGSEGGEYQVATEQGTNDEFGWTWQKSGEDFTWIKQNKVLYETGITSKSAATDSDKDNEYGTAKSGTGYPNFDVWQMDMTSPNSLLEGIFQLSLMLGTANEYHNTTGEDFFNHFKSGGGKDLIYAHGSRPSQIMLSDPRFKAVASTFEKNALTYFEKNRSLEGFRGRSFLSTPDLVVLLKICT
jgi:hypothetical protein